MLRWRRTGMLCCAAMLAVTWTSVATGAVLTFGDGTGFVENRRDNTPSSQTSLLSGGSLTLTEAVNGQARSVFYGSRIGTQNWTAAFDYTYAGGSGADGFTFAVQSSSANALGNGGGALGYGSGSASAGIPSSAAYVFDVYRNRVDLHAGGGGVRAERSPDAINLRSGQTVHVTLDYFDDSVLTARLDQGSSSFTRSYALKLGRTVGADAYFGFTGATGGLNAKQVITNFALTTGNTAAPAVKREMNIVAPGDPLIAVTEGQTTTRANSPNEGAAQAIDANPLTKYLNFDKSNTGFIVTPSIGATQLTGIALRAANDANLYPQRHPASVIVYGSNDGGVTFASAVTGTLNWSSPTSLEWRAYAVVGNVPSYTTYKVIFPTINDASNANSMQIADVDLYGIPSSPIPEPAVGAGMAMMGGALCRRRVR